MQFRCAVTKQLISAFCFATKTVLSLFSLNPKFQASSYLLCLHSQVCVIPRRKPKRQVFLAEGAGGGAYLRSVTRKSVFGVSDEV